LSDDIFYSYEPPIKLVNDDIEKYSSVMNHTFITKDDISLYNKYSVNSKDVLEEIIYGYDGEEFKINKDVSKINKYITTEEIISLDNKAKINNYISRRILDRNNFVIKFNRNIKLTNIKKVGAPLELIFLNENQEIYKGRYVSKGVNVIFNRERSTLFNCVVNLLIFRPNDTIKQKDS